MNELSFLEWIGIVGVAIIVIGGIIAYSVNNVVSSDKYKPIQAVTYDIYNYGDRFAVFREGINYPYEISREYHFSLTLPVDSEVSIYCNIGDFYDKMTALDKKPKEKPDHKFTASINEMNVVDCYKGSCLSSGFNHIAICRGTND